MTIRLLPGVFVVCGFAAGCAESPTAPTSALAETAASRTAATSTHFPETAGAHRHAPNDVITIVQGAVSVDYTTPEFAPDPFGTAKLQGTHGFKLDARLWSGGLFPGSLCRGGYDCVPGSTIPLDGVWGGAELPGTATFRGQRYEELEGQLEAYINVSASIVAPPEASTATVRVPFTLAEGAFSNGVERFQIEGRGTAIVRLRWNVEAWEVASVLYEFQGRGGH